MGGLIPIAVQAIQIASTVGGVVQAIEGGKQSEQSSKLALAQLQQQQQLNNQIRADQASLDRRQILATTKAAEEERRLSLKRAVARQRAEFGGKGVASGDGSSEAVLLGLFDESDQERKSRERLDKIKLQSIDTELSGYKRKNTLQLTQQRQKEKLKNSSNRLDTINDVLGAL